MKRKKIENEKQKGGNKQKTIRNQESSKSAGEFVKERKMRKAEGEASHLGSEHLQYLTYLPNRIVGTHRVLHYNLDMTKAS